MPRMRAAAAMLALSFAPWAPASAQQVLPRDIVITADRAALDVASTAGSRLGLSPLQVPASVEILDGDTVRARGDRSVTDAVTRATGITSVASPGNGGTALAARGFSGQGSVMLLIDGTRLYVGAGTLTFPFDPWTVDRIEVLRGPASVLYGEGAIGGAVNVVMRAPDPTRARYAARVGYGSDNTLRLAGSAGGRVAGALSYQLDGSVQRSDGWLDRGDGSRSVALSGSLRLDLSPRLAVTLANDFADQRPLGYFGTPVAASGLDPRLRRVNFNIGDDRLRFRDNWTRLTTSWAPTATIEVRNTAYRLTSRRRWRNAERYVVSPATGRVTRSDFIAIGHDQAQEGDRGDVRWGANVGGVANTLLVGFDINRIAFAHINNAPYRGSSVVDPFAFDPGRFTSPDPYTPGYATKTRQWSVFVEDRLALSPAWSIVGGARHDRVSFRRDDLRNRSNDFTARFDTASWRVGAVWQPAATASVYAQYATGSDPLGSLITTTAAQRDLDLPGGRQMEVGAKASLAGGHAELTIAAFDIVKTRLLSTDPANRLLVQQVGRRSSRGVEASASLALPGAVTIAANATALDARFDRFDEVVGGVVTSRTGRTPPGVPEVATNLWATWSPTGRLGLRGGVRHVGGRWTDNANTLRLSAYAVVDAGVRVALSPGVALDARIGNAFDRIHAVAGYGANQWLLGEPRRIDVTLDAAF